MSPSRVACDALSAVSRMTARSKSGAPLPPAFAEFCHERHPHRPPALPVTTLRASLLNNLVQNHLHSCVILKLGTTVFVAGRQCVALRWYGLTAPVEGLRQDLRRSWRRRDRRIDPVTLLAIATAWKRCDQSRRVKASKRYGKRRHPALQYRRRSGSNHRGPEPTAKSPQARAPRRSRSVSALPTRS